MLNLDPAKLLVIAVVAIILLGPDRLPQVARQVGGFWRTFNEYRHRMESQVRESMPDLPSSAEITRLARSPSALLDHISTMGSGREEEALPLVPRPVDPAPAATQAPTVDSPAHTVLHRAPGPAAARPETSSGETALPGDPGLN